MKEKVEQFKEILQDIANKENADKNSGYTAFFHPLIKDKQMTPLLLLFAVETLERLSMVSEGGVASKIAKSLVSFLPGVKKFYDGRLLFKPGDREDIEAIQKEINVLNYEYEGLRKILVCLLNYHGDVTLPRKGLVEADPMDLMNRYVSETDSMMIGTRTQARDWPKEEKSEKE